MYRRLAAALAAALAIGSITTAGVVTPARAADCPNGGTVRFGVEPFEAAAKVQPLFDQIGQMVGAKLGCKVEVFVATNYNAEIEAMRAGKLEIAEFGPLGYILAHQIAHAEAVATYATPDGKKPAVYFASIVTQPGSGITSLKQVAGRSFAYSDPDSTSGHLFPAYALRKAGIDPDSGVKGVYAGSHTASFEALRNKKVEAGEFNSQVAESASTAGTYKNGDFVTLWRSDPIPSDPIAVRGDLPDAFKARVREAFLSLELSSIDPQHILKGFGYRFVAANDGMYQQIRDLVTTLNIDLTKM
jgi:phosphonate transport system substrate-binding protein